MGRKFAWQTKILIAIFVCIFAGASAIDESIKILNYNKARNKIQVHFS